MRTVPFIALVFLAALVFFAALPPLVCSQVAAPTQPSSARSRNLKPAPDLLDINSATVDQLKSLPGFGLEYARRVIAGRPYIAKSQLVARGVIPLNAYNQVAPLIIAHHHQR